MEPSGFALNVLETRATLDLREQEQWLLFLMCQHIARQRSTHAAVQWVFICTWTGYLSVYIPSIYVEDWGLPAFEMVRQRRRKLSLLSSPAEVSPWSCHSATKLHLRGACSV